MTPALASLPLAASDVERLRTVLPALFEATEQDITVGWKLGATAEERDRCWHRLQALEALRASWEELLQGPLRPPEGG